MICATIVITLSVHFEYTLSHIFIQENACEFSIKKV